MKYRKKPIEVEAIQATGENNAEIIEWAKDSRTPAVMSDRGQLCLLGDGEFWPIYSMSWIIRRPNGENYMCDPDTFEATYEPVED